MIPEPRTPRLSARALIPFLLALVMAVTMACRPAPVPDDAAPAVTPSGWTDTARTVLSALSWAVPGAQMVTGALLPEPARTVVNRALAGVGAAAENLEVALAAYESRGGDRCAAKAAVAGVRASLVATAQALADNGIALGRVLERVADSAAALVDELVPACDPDAGWRSEGRQTNAELREIELRATARGIILRRDLDDLHPDAAPARVDP